MAEMHRSHKNAGSVELTIAAGATASDAFNARQARLIGIFIPGTLTGTSLTVQALRPAYGATPQTWCTVRDSAGTALTVDGTEDSFIVLTRDQIGPAQTLRLVSASAETPARTIHVLLAD